MALAGSPHNITWGAGATLTARPGSVLTPPARYRVR